MHSLIVSSLHPEEEDKILTADEVISEIDDMMKVSSNWGRLAGVEKVCNLVTWKITVLAGTGRNAKGEKGREK